MQLIKGLFRIGISAIFFGVGGAILYYYFISSKDDLWLYEKLPALARYNRAKAGFLKQCPSLSRHPQTPARLYPPPCSSAIVSRVHYLPQNPELHEINVQKEIRETHENTDSSLLAWVGFIIFLIGVPLFIFAIREIRYWVKIKFGPKQDFNTAQNNETIDDFRSSYR